MGLLQKLYETYENNAHMAGVQEAGRTMLAPIYHIVFNAQIEITLTCDGQFYGAKTVAKGDRETLIPSVEEAAGRSVGIAPFPLSDQLQYIALGAPSYAGHAGFADKYRAYLDGLARWAESAYSHPKVRAIYQYCRRGTTIADLAAADIVKLDQNGFLASGKIEGNPYDKCVVRWRVLPPPEDPGAVSEAWQDPTLIQSYIAYFTVRQSEKEQDVCYISGKISAVMKNHAKGLVRNAYGAKLISVNDSSNFTYRGRFVEKEEPMAVSAEGEQKALNALKWLIANQGVTLGERTFLCWNPKGKALPEILSADDAFFNDDNEKKSGAFTMPEYRKRLYKALNGWKECLDDHDDILILALEAATTGRLSVTYYNELKASDFFVRILKWNSTCCWYYYQSIGTPAVNRIVECAFGTEQGKLLIVKNNLMGQQVQRIFTCVIEERPIPAALVQKLTVRASMPLAYHDAFLYQRVLFAACALIRKYHNDKTGKEEWSMELDTENTNRSYLFGRLLAVAEQVERRTYSKEESREPNAIRLQTVFCRRPLSTWKILEERLQPYFARLRVGSRMYYKDLIAEIVSKLLESDARRLNQSLEEVYLLGYYLQRKELYNKKDKNETEE